LIRSEKHTLNSIEVTKDGLINYDDKRYLLSDGINTLSFGHYKIN
jgi:hypothetical protein